MTTPTPDEITDGLRAQLKTACQAARDEAARADKLERDLTAAQAELAAMKAENSKLRSALEIVHFKQEPWQ